MGGPRRGTYIFKDFDSRCGKQITSSAAHWQTACIVGWRTDAKPLMAATQHVTLTELLEVQDDAISEINGWSLLRQSVVTLLESKGTNNYSLAASAQRRIGTDKFVKYIHTLHIARYSTIEHSYSDTHTHTLTHTHTDTHTLTHTHIH